MQYRPALLLSLLVLASSVLAAQHRVGGLNLNYPHPFRARPEIGRAIMEQQSSDTRRQIVNIEVFSAATDGEITEVTVIGTRFQPSETIDLNGAALGAVENVKRLAGVSKPTHSIQSTFVSGHPARRVSLEADSRVGRFGLEAVLVHDRKTNTLWAVQCSFGRRDVHKLEPLRQKATSILASIALAP